MKLILGWIGGIDDDRILGLLIRHEIGIVVARALPCYSSASLIFGL